jgi:hypothetical protein
MVPLAMLMISHGVLFGTDGVPHLLNRRWCTVPTSPLEDSYEWELQSKREGGMTLQIFTKCSQIWQRKIKYTV